MFLHSLFSPRSVSATRSLETRQVFFWCRHDCFGLNNFLSYCVCKEQSIFFQPLLVSKGKGFSPLLVRHSVFPMSSSVPFLYPCSALNSFFCSTGGQIGKHFSNYAPSSAQYSTNPSLPLQKMAHLLSLRIHFGFS